MKSKKFFQELEKDNYFKPLCDFLLANKDALGAGIHHIYLRHDDWCDMLNGGLHCNCNPEIAIDDGDE